MGQGGELGLWACVDSPFTINVFWKECSQGSWGKEQHVKSVHIKMHTNQMRAREWRRRIFLQSKTGIDVRPS